MSLALTIVVAVASVWFIRRLVWVWRVNRIPGVESCPFGLIGDIGFVRAVIKNKGSSRSGVLENIEPTVFDYNRKVGETGLLRVWLGPVPHVFVTDAEHVEVLLSSNEVITKGYQYMFVRPWLKEGLILSTGDKWRKRRKMLTPSFHFQILEQFVPIINRNGGILINKLQDMAVQNNGLIPDISHSIVLCALDVICETAMGERINAQSNPDGMYITAVSTMTEVLMDRALKPWLFPDFIFNMTSNAKRMSEALRELHGFTSSVIQSRMKNITSMSRTGKDEDSEIERRKEPFMDALIRKHIQDPNDFTEDDIREEVDNFMFAGHDTTAWGIIWCTYLLGHNPKCQRKVQEEVDAIHADKGTDEDLTMDDLRTRLNYTEAAVKEAQRLYSSLPVFARSTEKDFQMGKHVVPAGCQLFVPSSVIHHSPKYWSDPLTFKPERFLSAEKRHPYAFIPFSAGPRNCIGQKFAMLEEKALIAKIFRKFTVTSLDPRESVKPLASVIRTSNIPIRVRLEVRQITQ